MDGRLTADQQVSSSWQLPLGRARIPTRVRTTCRVVNLSGLLAPKTHPKPTAEIDSTCPASLESPFA
jgi:hypothetical protein